MTSHTPRQAHAIMCESPDEPAPQEGASAISDMARIDKALTDLRRSHLAWPKVRSHTGYVALLTWTELRATGTWELLPEQDQASMYAVIALGRVLNTAPESGSATQAAALVELCDEVEFFLSYLDQGRQSQATAQRAILSSQAEVLLALFHTLPTLWQARVLQRLHFPTSTSVSARPVPTSFLASNGREEVPSLAEEISSAARATAHRRLPPIPSTLDTTGLRMGADLSARLAQLPPGWQIHAFRRIVSGGADSLKAISDAAKSIDIVRAYGIYVASRN